MSSLRGLWITNKHQHCIENHFVTVELKKVSQVLEKSTQSAQSAWSARSAVCSLQSAWSAFWGDPFRRASEFVIFQFF